MNDPKPLLSFSIDLDDLWSYLKIKGDPRWKTFPSYLHLFIPYFLDLLDEKKLTITFFIVGQDAAFEKNHTLLQEIVRRGHEVANHTFSHEPWLHLYTEEELYTEVVKAEEAIFAATGKLPCGFRGPGFTWSPPLLKLLSNRGYIYDSTTLPTYIGPLARLYYFWIARLNKKEQEDRQKLFGSFWDGWRSIDPYLWQLPNEKQLLEIPVTTIPIIKTPFHLSYLMYLCTFSPRVANAYLQTAYQACRLAKTTPNFLLHPPDFMDDSQIPELSFFPGINYSKEKKKEFFFKIIETFSQHYTISNMSSRALENLENPRVLKVVKP